MGPVCPKIQLPTLTRQSSGFCRASTRCPLPTGTKTVSTSCAFSNSFQTVVPRILGPPHAHTCHSSVQAPAPLGPTHTPPNSHLAHTKNQLGIHPCNPSPPYGALKTEHPTWMQKEIIEFSNSCWWAKLGRGVILLPSECNPTSCCTAGSPSAHASSFTDICNWPLYCSTNLTYTHPTHTNKLSSLFPHFTTPILEPLVTAFFEVSSICECFEEVIALVLGAEVTLKGGLKRFLCVMGDPKVLGACRRVRTAVLSSRLHRVCHAAGEDKKRAQVSGGHPKAKCTSQNDASPNLVWFRRTPRTTAVGRAKPPALRWSDRPGGPPWAHVACGSERQWVEASPCGVRCGWWCCWGPSRVWFGSPGVVVWGRCFARSRPIPRRSATQVTSWRGFDTVGREVPSWIAHPLCLVGLGSQRGDGPFHWWFFG